MNTTPAAHPYVVPFRHADTDTWTYVVSDPATRVAAIVDPVLDYDGAAARTNHTSADEVVGYCRERRLDVRWILETHAHADHLSAAQYLKRELGAEVVIGAGIRDVQAKFQRIYGLGAGFATDGSQFDRLVSEGDELPLGELAVRVIATPGHTNDSVTYLVGDAAFIGDTLFMPDTGSARCDFPGGDAAELYRSVQKLYSLPPDTRLFVCHDYPPGGAREHRAETSVEEQRVANVHIRDGVDEAAFVHLRTARDATLPVPRLIIPSVQVNIRAGHLPDSDADGVSYLRVPVNVFGGRQE
jgi:glyoxylase-like metal-dependent hydrolase (beta-lactamase superfamily II)